MNHKIEPVGIPRDSIVKGSAVINLDVVTPLQPNLFGVQKLSKRQERNRCDQIFWDDWAVHIPRKTHWGKM